MIIKPEFFFPEMRKKVTNSIKFETRFFITVRKKNDQYKKLFYCLFERTWNLLWNICRKSLNSCQMRKKDIKKLNSSGRFILNNLSWKNIQYMFLSFKKLFTLKCENDTLFTNIWKVGCLLKTWCEKTYVKFRGSLKEYEKLI